MPWETSFEESDVIDAAMGVFWAKGYSETSLIDLIETTGVQRGSLYNTFGGKRELFELALVKYDRENRVATCAQLEKMKSPLAAIKLLFNEVVKQAGGECGQNGCMLINTALNLTHHDEKIRAFVKKGLDEFAQFFERLVKRGQKLGEIPGHVAARSTSKALLSMVIGLRVMARGSSNRQTLNHVAKQALRLLS